MREIVKTVIRTQKGRTKELVDKMYACKATQCATHAVNEILKLPFELEKERQYWQDVKTEIDLLK